MVLEDLDYSVLFGEWGERNGHLEDLGRAYGRVADAALLCDHLVEERLAGHREV